jgi:hypothetical protein
MLLLYNRETKGSGVILLTGKLPTTFQIGGLFYLEDSMHSSARYRLMLFAFIFFITLPARANIIGTEYIQKHIKSVWNIDIPTPGGTISSSRHLFASIDFTNKILNGRATNYVNLASDNIIAQSRADIELLSKIKYCAAGMYLPMGSNDCTDCGTGYYCTGGSAHHACTYGISGCPGMNHETDNLPPVNIIQDGLIVHLDAIQNTVTGHDANATVWKDISGNNNDFSFLDPAPSFESQSIKFDQTNQYAKSINPLKLNGYDAVTVEVRFTIIDPARSAMVFEQTENWNKKPGAFGMYANVDSSNYYPNACHTNQSSGGLPNTYECKVSDLLSHTITNTFSAVPNATGRLFYFDGMTMNSGFAGWHNNGTNAAATMFADDYFYIARRRSEVVEFRSNIEINSLRIYNRQLSASEICQNNWSDWRRFGGAVPVCAP